MNKLHEGRPIFNVFHVVRQFMSREGRKPVWCWVGMAVWNAV